MDVVTPAVRSRMMAGIRTKGTRPEMVVRRALHAAGFRFRLHRKDLPGAPDVVLPGRRLAVFVHGCFWHMHEGCRYAKMPSTRREFWQKKLEGNALRDRKAVGELLADGWRVLVVWECAIRNPDVVATLSSTLAGWVRGGDAFGEVAGGSTP